MIEIVGGELYQWDTGRSASVSSEADKVHFANQGDSKAVVMDLVDSVTKVPDYLLQTGRQLCVYAVKDGVTIEKRMFSVTKRERPEDYVYEDDKRNYIYELIRSAEEAAAEANRVADELRTAKANGEFKGDPGVVKFMVVNELPQEDTENAIYLVPDTEGAQDNLFDEYIWVDEKWEKIGSTAVAVDLTDYVKKTDYATQATAGLVRVYNGGYHGLKVNSDGLLTIYNTTEAEIAARKEHRAITASRLDYAIKSGLTTNKEEWTEEEKQAARDLVGAVGDTEFARVGKCGIVKTVSTNDDGIYINTEGAMSISVANTASIDNRKTKQPITPTNLDYAVKSGLITNAITLTDEEKAAAQTWLGIPKAITQCVEEIILGGAW